VVAWPGLAALCLILPKLGQGGFSVDTGWYSALALQAWRDAIGEADPGALWSLRGPGGADGPPYLNKPPLAFWLHGLSLHALGPTVLAARLPAALAAALCCSALAVCVGLRAGRRAGLLAGLVLALTWEFTRHARAFSLDMWLVLFLVGAACPVAAALGGRGSRVVLLSGLLLGLGLLTKPLIAALALPLLGAWVVGAGRRELLWWLGGAGLLMIVVAAPWHVSMYLRHGSEFAEQYFGREIVARAAGRLPGANRGSGAWWYYLAELARSYWPWLVTMLLGLAALGRSQFRRAHRGPAWHWALWLGAWVLALSLHPDRRPRYALMIYPAGAALSALWLIAAAPRPIRAAARHWPRAAPGLAVLVGVVLALAPIRIHRPDEPQWPELFAHLRERGIGLVHDGGLAGARAARLYLELGSWPVPTRDRAGRVTAPPPPGAHLLYHRRDGWGPGPGEVVLWERGALTLTRLEAPPWRPVLRPDPGE